MSVAQPGAATTVGTIPRDYNFAADILKRNLDAGRGGKAAFIDDRGEYTYADLAGRVERFGHVLRSLGNPPRGARADLLLDTVDWPTAFLGAIKAGIVAVPVNTLMTEDDYRFMLDDSRARSWSCPTSCCRIRQGDRRVKDLAVIVSGEKAQNHPRFDDLLAGAKTEAVTAPTTRDDYVLLALYLRLDRQAEGRRAHAMPI